MAQINYDEFVRLTDAQIQRMSDAELAANYTAAVVLNQKANVSRDIRVFRYGEAVIDLSNRLEAEMARRGKTWEVPFYGRPYLK